MTLSIILYYHEYMSSDTEKNEVNSKAKYSSMLQFVYDKKTLALIIIVFLVGIIGGYYVFQIVSPKQNIIPQQENKITYKETIVSDINNEPTTIYITPKTSTMGVGEELTMEIKMMGKSATAVDFAVIYDPEIFDVKNIEGSNLFSQDVGKKSGDGKIYYAAMTKDKNPRSNATVATFTLVAKKSSTGSHINFEVANTKIAVDSKEVLGTAYGSYIIVNE